MPLSIMLSCPQVNSSLGFESKHSRMSFCGWLLFSKFFLESISVFRFSFSAGDQQGKNHG